MFQGIYNGSQKHEADLNRVLDRAYVAGMEKIIVTVGMLEDCEPAFKLVNQSEKLYATCGVHPTRCGEFLNDPEGHFQALVQQIETNKKKVVAIGECGLDYDRLQFCEKDVQKKFFEKQLDLVEKFKLPLFLHCRAAHDDLTELLNKNIDKLAENRGVVHTFDGTLEQAMQFIDLGFYIGINGCSLKSEDNLKVVAEIPNDRILLETDAPWCDIRSSHAGSKHVKSKFPAVKKKEKWEKDSLIAGRCEPIQIVQVLEVIAGAKGENAEKLAEQIYQNTLKVFFSNANDVIFEKMMKI